LRRPFIEERLVKLAEYAESFPYNQITWGERHLGVVSSGVAYQYAREVFSNASFLKLGMSYPLPQRLIGEFAARVEKLLVVEELDPFLEENIRAMGIEVMGKEFLPRIGELTPLIVHEAGFHAGLLSEPAQKRATNLLRGLPGRPPVLCAGCPHTGIFFVLSTIGQRSRLLDAQGKAEEEGKLIITGDIGCYTLATYPPLRAMDTTACMGAGIGQALGMEKAGISGGKVVAVIGDSTFLHSGITGVVDAVYNLAQVTIIILDNNTTAMTGHQNHPGTGISAQGKKTKVVELERLVRGTGVEDVKVVDAFNIKALRAAVRDSLAKPELSVIIVRGTCSVRLRKRSGQRAVDAEKCDDCGVCLSLGCPAIQKLDGRLYIDISLCAGDACTICEQLCPRKAISPLSNSQGAKQRE
ncbi:MAG TPA: indolepyruvate ferredoxin oxidoreductase subunit alpha, partial [Dehalococcoidia bacterium]|nr:indolepyruvate ferredoxin oxidoreductase subunit alpha [Dehalococcoidia bacterium]